MHFNHTTKCLKKSILRITVKLYLTIPTVIFHAICFLYGIFCNMKLNTRPTIESKRSEDNCLNITIKTDKSSTIYLFASILTTNGYNFHFGVRLHHRYSNGNSLRKQNNLYLTIPTVIFHAICFLYGIFCNMKLNTRPTIESKRSEDNCLNITIKTDISSTIYLFTSILTTNGYNFHFGVRLHHRYSNGNSLRNQNNEKINFDAGIQLYFNNVPDDKQQRLDLQQINQYVHISEFKNKLILTPLLTQSDDEGTNIKYYNKADPISNTYSNGETSLADHSPMNMRSKNKTSRTRQQNNRNTWKPLLIVSIDNIVRQSVEEYLSSKRQYEKRPMVHWPSMHPLLPFKDRHLDDDDISKKN
ncbi:uncharacterized protein LOC143048588 isoform X1 [Mytilus galloprovincialis]|uniref:uncharacterized protein LOC143048588 isoform X1 n=3 Tax=Mytilus galloprovincialis TaxID=29158 RepID=UPI003F7BE053